MKVLITGATGFLGRHLTKKLKQNNFEVFISNTKIRNLNNIKNLLDLPKLDYIFHLACHTKAGDWCLYHPGDQWEINQTINTNIISYWKNYQPQAKMIAMGTSCSYSSELPMSEENYMKGDPDPSLYTYAMTKRILLQGLISMNKQYNLNYVCFIPSTLYGNNYDLDDNHFIFDLIRKIKKGKTENKIVSLWGNGFQRRELIHVDDAINLIISLKDINNEVINLSTGLDYSIREYAEKISKIIDYDYSIIEYDTTKYTGVFRKNLSIDKLSKLQPNFKFISLEKGLSELL